MLYAFVLHAEAILQDKNRMETSALPGACIAVNENEAVGIALKEAYSRFPKEEGWRSHQVAVCLIPESKVKESLKDYF